MSIKLKEIPLSERPYEKLEMQGAENLSNSELLAIIIKTGTKEESALTLAQRVLNLNKQTLLFFLSAKAGILKIPGNKWIPKG